MKYLADSDFLFGLFVAKDPHNNESKLILKRVVKNSNDLLVLNLVVQETATVLSRKDKQSTAVDFLNQFQKMPVQIILLDEEIESFSWEIFRKQTKKRTSFVDCANLATLEKYKLDGILSFDEFYPPELKVK
ncbi:hypothetical protein A2714_05745 [Candidatus Woesebacteria bacterium RIFCSPHIGHO2_01_FULL_38_9]|uniref:PIN domain-containing protein n=2 Tax=Candidatus Woeseibacteriota TaxID=1752722 RepID=A0A1F7Y1V0_9BACT|nr:MAG: hypothetical protein A2714_05745 [Candidatus Woesebacteria bacterium RIFCSPHIGHO2_01_FULL_38_9]OGM59065.1 MAG: hypothetical protein A3A75_05360 [Candidatus Woesebacteria bacterium RIFCSPLOWO2_01_FULL_39_10]